MIYPYELPCPSCPVCQATPKQIEPALDSFIIKADEFKFGCPPHFYYYIKADNQEMNRFLLNIILSEDAFMQFAKNDSAVHAKQTIYLWNKKAATQTFPVGQDMLSPSEAYRLLQRYYKLLAFS